MPTTLSTHQHKLPLLFALGSTTAIAALAFGYRFFTKTLSQKTKQTSSSSVSDPSSTAGSVGGSSSSTDQQGGTTATTTEEEEDAEAVRVMQPYFEQAVELSRTLKVNHSGMTPNDQLMLYGLYKQAKFGDCNVDAPSKLRIKEHAKHKAWTKFTGMAQPFAIMKYMEAVQHFATLASTNNNNNHTAIDSQSTTSDTSLSPIPSTPQTNYSYIDEDDDSDIVYEDDNGEVDTDDDEDDTTGADQSVGAFSLETRETDPQNFGMGGTQSTLMSYRHSSLDLGKMSFDSTGGVNSCSSLGGGGGIVEGVGVVVGANGLEPYEEEEHPGKEDDMSILQAAIHNRPERLRECIRQYQEEDERIQQQQQQQQGVISSSSNNLNDDGSAITRPTTNKPLVRRHNLNQTDDTGQTPLHMASDKGHTECVSFLIQAGADVNAIDDAGISVLGAAVYGEDVEVVKMLLDAGADPDHEDEDGDTPRRVAEEGSCEEIKVLLEGFERRLGSGSMESEDGSYRQ